MARQKRVFIEALILAIVVFGLGVTLGFFVESWRADKITSMYTQAEIGLLDIKIITQIYDTVDINCEEAVRQNLEFADRIYQEAVILERYEGAQRLGEELITQHKKYDLLRTSLWLNSQKTKNNCKDDSYDTIVYLYQYNEPDIEKKALQAVYSRALGELKEEFGSEMMLLPMAGDLDIKSIDILKEHYGVTELPAIIINEKKVFTGTITKEEILSILNK
ncbi:hypothetical protein COU61_05165 [Candidatus Pacearchaeota archaeon CG10_big_fil_rev_8_21_14_0_10_35_13]|nr:MAG: hypothetical protein COU61_05165 [Candidatus Pacearchaeota archaeon CG10_big_fil_rev_8_21_14_0_10_35_13]